MNLTYIQFDRSQKYEKSDYLPEKFCTITPEMTGKLFNTIPKSSKLLFFD